MTCSNSGLTSKVWIRKFWGRDAAPLALKTIEALQPIKDLIHTITADNGNCEITDGFVSWVENKLNNRPGKRLGYLTPNEKFNSVLTN